MLDYSSKCERSREFDNELAAIFCIGKVGTDPGGDRNRKETYCGGQQTCGRGPRMAVVR